MDERRAPLKRIIRRTQEPGVGLVEWLECGHFNKNPSHYGYRSRTSDELASSRRCPFCVERATEPR